MRRPDHALVARRRRIAPLLAVSLFGVLALGTAPIAHGAEPDPDQAKKNSLDNKIDQAHEDLDDISANLVAANRNLAATRTALAGAKVKLTAAEAARSEAEAVNAEALQELAVAKANEAKAEAELAATRKQIADSRARVAGFASQVYMDQGMGALSVAMESESPGDFAERLSMVGTVMDIAQQKMLDLSTAQASQTAQQDHLSSLRADSAAAQDRAERSLNAATSARNAAAAAKTSLETAQAKQAAATATLAQRKAAELASISSMTAESKRLQKILAARAAARAAAAAKAAAAAAARRAASQAPPTNGGYLSSPMPGAPITSEYGSRFHPILQIWRLHSGTDFGAACGTPIRAAAPGTIVSAGYNGGYGNRVVIDHGYVRGVDLASAYNHMSSIAKSSGNVVRGQIIGYEGTTGLSTGCHLHFEVMENGGFVNPRKWL